MEDLLMAEAARRSPKIVTAYLICRRCIHTDTCTYIISESDKLVDKYSDPTSTTADAHMCYRESDTFEAAVNAIIKYWTKTCEITDYVIQSS